MTEPPCPLQQAKAIFQLTAHRKYPAAGFETLRQHNGRGCITAGPAQYTRFSGRHAQDRIIQPVDDIPVMQQKIVGNLRQTVARILIVDALGFVAAVPGCQHDGTINPCISSRCSGV